tara:strand:+ start:287 stop:580 length:294 start_codon:yes stop_codon:yes gene_type:complete
MKIIIILAALMLAQNVESREEFFVINCGRDSIMFPISAFPFGVSLSNREICACSKKGWRGLQCNVDFQNQLLASEIERKNNLIIDRLLRGITYDVEL